VVSQITFSLKHLISRGADLGSSTKYSEKVNDRIYRQIRKKITIIRYHVRIFAISHEDYVEVQRKIPNTKIINWNGYGSISRM